LVVYYSRTGNTKSVAEKIAGELGAEIEEVVDKKKRSGVLGFLSGGKDATVGSKTKIAETRKNPGDFDLIVVGTPIWSSSPTPAIRTYLSKHDLAGKKVAVFCTSEGSGTDKAKAKIKALIPNGDSVEILVLLKPNKDKVDTDNKIVEWCGRLKSL
jgi:flavodoxin